MTARAVLATCLVGLASMACVEDAIDDEIRDRMEAAKGLEERICEAMQASSGVAVDAASSVGQAPPVSGDRRRHDIALVDTGGPRQGFVSFTPDEQQTWRMVIAENLQWELLGESGAPISPTSETMGSEVCIEVLVNRTYDLAPGNYTHSFGPTSSPDVRLVVTVDSE